MGEPEGDRAERIRSEQEAAASEDLEAICALAAAADSPGAEAAAGEPMDTGADKDTADEDAGKSTTQQASAGTKRPPESGGAINAEDEARHKHGHNHEWLVAKRQSHTRVGRDFQVAALPTPHPRHSSIGAGNGANGSGGAKVDDPKKDTKG